MATATVFFATIPGSIDAENLIMKSPLGLNTELPVGDMISEAVNLLWQKRQQVLAMFLPAILLLAFVDWTSSQFIPTNHWGQLLFLIVSLLLSVLFATAAHRFTLLPQEQWNRNAIHMWKREEFGYLLRALQIGIMAAVLFFIIMVALMMVLGKELMPLAAVAGALPALYIWGRFSVTLPEVALGRKTSLKRAWAMSEGNGSRMVLVVIIIPLLMTAPFLLLYLLDIAVLNYVAAFGSYITTLISLVMLSLTYRFLLSFYEQTPEEAVDRPDTEDEDDDTDNRPGNGGFDA
ncbi:MAG: hypothetical protein CMI02_15345 [Oceanospirillaceae bacterium]|nr:hypothetical protein [Oceanospirillaceae bacterium]MBT13398.1 hypothetical protein [Oceanospirillaceae bacterium]